jgi:hypothetical protein
VGGVAVVPHSSVPVTVEERGFTTNALRVIVDDHLRLTVADLQGNVVQKDAAPVQWEGNRFYRPAAAWQAPPFGSVSVSSAAGDSVSAAPVSYRPLGSFLRLGPLAGFRASMATGPC